MSEFERYLNDQIGMDDCKDVLIWWKLNEFRFPVLARMARDILAIPLSTVTSGSAFSIGGRTLDPFRSSLSPKMVQALVCGQDWLQAKKIRGINAKEKVDVEVTLEELEEYEKDLENSSMDNDMVYVNDY